MVLDRRITCVRIKRFLTTTVTWPRTIPDTLCGLISMPLGNTSPSEEIFHRRGDFNQLGLAPLATPEAKAKGHRVSRLAHRQSRDGVSGVGRNRSTCLAAGAGVVIGNQQGVQLDDAAVVGRVRVTAVNGPLGGAAAPAEGGPEVVALRSVDGDGEVIKVLTGLSIVLPRAVAEGASCIVVRVVPGRRLGEGAHPVALVVFREGPVSEPLGICDRQESSVDR